MILTSSARFLFLSFSSLLEVSEYSVTNLELGLGTLPLFVKSVLFTEIYHSLEIL